MSAARGAEAHCQDLGRVLIRLRDAAAARGFWDERNRFLHELMREVEAALALAKADGVLTDGA